MQKHHLNFCFYCFRCLLLFSHKRKKMKYFQFFSIVITANENKATMNSRFLLLMDAAQETKKNQFHFPNINLSLNFVITSFCLFVCFIVSSTIQIHLSLAMHTIIGISKFYLTHKRIRNVVHALKSHRNDGINLICFFYDSINKSIKRNIHENDTIRNWSDAIDIAKKGRNDDDANTRKKGG